MLIPEQLFGLALVGRCRLQHAERSQRCEAYPEFDCPFFPGLPAPAQACAAAHLLEARAGHTITCTMRCHVVRAETTLLRLHIAFHMPGTCCQTSVA
eukprot:2636429-Pyramimonas_sp.AAC.1